MRNRRLLGSVALAGAVHAFLLVLVLHRAAGDLWYAPAAATADPVSHWVRDALLYVPAGIALLLAATLAARRLGTRWTATRSGVGAVVLWAGCGAAVYAVASVPANLAHGVLFASEHAAGVSALQLGNEAILTLRYSFAVLVAFACLAGVPWTARGRPAEPARADISISGRNGRC